ncbi:peptidoglycan-binding protein [Candidatus Viadribacter manganicus]|uniref:Peptidoglycan binding-like domain-containing protein n=1 Tax=Candidatus Viadribacter manganicus TaxID=1759059 RepID=A0A1B1ALW6_9PROT|nr:peptidoglycan-binding protein [Candidatus Viadribacter manganicus]ANP47559.1 hypothetical protein ATE48_17435 [Candidatus Viadribacter manganicus]
MQFFSVRSIDEIDFNKLMQALPNRAAWNPLSTQGQYISAILQSYPMLRENGINTALRLAHFLGQGIVETNFMQAKSENLNYSFTGLKRVFGHKFSSDDEIREYARKPERIANRVYANRMGNGPEESGDGWKYRGRGFFQLTGKDNYRRYGELAGIDLVSDPDILERDLKVSLQVAAAYFNRTGLGEHADRNDVAAVSRGVNRGDAQSRAPAHGEAERIEWTTKALSLVRDPASVLTIADDALRVGSSGDAVVTLQRKLNSLGYTAGLQDGIFGPTLRRAVLAFQDEHGLTPSGVADQSTQAAIETALEEQRAPQTPTPPSPTQPQPQPPLTQSRTIWGAILAGLAAIAEFVRASFSRIADAFPIVTTPLGPFNTIYALALLLTIGLLLIVYARVDDRSKGKR